MIILFCMIAQELIELTRRFSKKMDRLRFGGAIAHVYNPLDYARRPHEEYLRRYSDPGKTAVFLGMNPGPFGMAQTGVPFGEVSAVRDWLKISAETGRPSVENPKRPIEGFSCVRSEVSGKRLWGAIAALYRTPDRFFSKFFVANYCPLVFMESGGRNVTPDKLSGAVRALVYGLCDEYLRESVRLLRPQWVIGVGKFAEKRAQEALASAPVRIDSVLHPSPASPAANKDWAGKFKTKLRSLGLI